MKGWAPQFSGEDADVALTCDDGALFRADPFLFTRDGKFYVFYEAMPRDSEVAYIGVAESEDGFRWRYVGPALIEPFHLSFPHVFEWNGSSWMVPETHSANQVAIYEPVDFPTRWKKHTELLNMKASDSVLFEHDGNWYMFTSPNMKTLLLFCAKSPLGPWREHPKSPIITNDLVNARPAGRVLSVDGKRYRVAQDCDGVYGRKVSSYEILEISPSHYQEKRNGPVPGLGPGPEKWRRGGMHHVDALQLADSSWLVAVDGWRKVRSLRQPKRSAEITATIMAMLRGNK